jgi:hypothetical protein
MTVLALDGLRLTLRLTRPRGATDAATEGDRRGLRGDRRGHGGRQTRPQGRQTRPRGATDAATGATDAATGGDRRICRTTLASACSGGGDRRGGAEHQICLSIVFVKWSLLECVLRRDGR